MLLGMRAGLVRRPRPKNLEAIKAQVAADYRRLIEIHAEYPSCRDQFDEGTAMFGNNNALPTRRGGGGFPEASFGLT